MRDRTISTFAFTKAYAMDGWRLGYVAAKKEFVDAVYKVVLNETTHPNVFAQEGALAAVVSPQDSVAEMVKEDRRRRDLVYDRLNAMPNVKCDKPHATIYCFPDFGGLGKTSGRARHGAFGGNSCGYRVGHVLRSDGRRSSENLFRLRTL